MTGNNLKTRDIFFSDKSVCCKATHDVESG